MSSQGSPTREKEDLEIIFDTRPAVYREGDKVAGDVRIQSTQDIKYKVIRIELCGIAVVRKFSESGEKDVEPDVIRAGCNTEKYFHKKIILCEKESSQGKGDAVLNSGEHSFPFEFKLPPELPSSFEGQFGQIRYLTRAIIERQSKNSIITKRAFTVLSGLDLNFIPEAAGKIEICKYKQVGNCCTTGSVTFDWTVERSGFVPGEDIWINGAVQNESRETVAYSKVTLYMVISYKHKKGRRKERRRIALADKGETLPDDITVWHDSIHIPPAPPTGLSRSIIIDITYELEFKALIEGSQPIVYTKDIYIGTVPMSRKEMKSCIAGMFNQPYAASTDTLDAIAAVRAARSEASLTHIIAAASANTPMASPTAPSLPSLDIELAEGNDAATPTGESPLLDRPPPFAPGYSVNPAGDDSPVEAAPPSAPPSAITLQRPYAHQPNVYPDLTEEPTYEASSIFGPVNLHDQSDDGQSLRGEYTYYPVYTYFGTLPYGAQPRPPPS